MEVLPISSAAHLIRSPTQVVVGSRGGHRFKACLLNSGSASISPPRRINYAPPPPPPPRRKEKVVFVLGSTGAGKSKLAIDLATHFGGEVVNSDKMQVYDGLNIITNKVTEEECAGIPHHLIGGVHPDADFAASDFCRVAMKAVESILARGRLPIIAGGSNSYIAELVDGQAGEFRSKYECCFVWIDVDVPVLDWFVSARVDKMVEMGLVEEARGFYRPDGDYSKGIRRSIGVQEMDRYFRSESWANEETKASVLEKAIREIKSNTCQLIRNQLVKIRRLSSLPNWDVRTVDVTEAFLKRGYPEFGDAWNRVAKEPSVEIVRKFLNRNLDICILKSIMTIADANGTATSEAPAESEHRAPAMFGGTHPPALVYTTTRAHCHKKKRAGKGM